MKSSSVILRVAYRANETVAREYVDAALARVIAHAIEHGHRDDVESNTLMLSGVEIRVNRATRSVVFD